MANNNEWPQTRFLFSDMFSFSFEPEILTFLWGICTQKADDIQRDCRYLFPTSSLLKIFVPFEGQRRTNFLTFLKATVVTGGTLVFVGLSSYGAFKVLQKLRYHQGGGFAGKVTSSLTKFLTRYCWKSSPELTRTSNSLELVLRGGENSSTTNNGNINSNPIVGDFPKRPSELILVNNGGAHSNNGTSCLPSPGYNNMLQNRLNGNSKVPTVDYFSVSPINGDIASGDEDGAEVQGRYFGPPLDHDEENHNKSIVDSFVVATIQQSPEDALLREKYELLKTQQQHPPPCLPSAIQDESTHNHDS